MGNEQNANSITSVETTGKALLVKLINYFLIIINYFVRTFPVLFFDLFVPVILYIKIFKISYKK